MSPSKESLNDRLLSQIDKLNQTYTNLQIQIHYLNAEMGKLIFSEDIFNSRKNQLEKAMDNVQETILFLESLSKGVHSNYVKVG